MLAPSPNLEQLRKQAKELLEGCRAGDPGALRRFSAYLPGLDATGPTVSTGRSGVRLAHTQRVIAREHGYSSWPKLHAACAAAHQIEAALDAATAVAVPVGSAARAEFADARTTAVRLLARRRDVHRLSLCLTSMALRDVLAIRALLRESGDLGLVVDTLILGLMHPHPDTRYRCAGALDHFGDERCVEPLRHLVADPVPRVRRMALHALGCDACKLLPFPRDCDVLALIIDRALNDTSISVRRHAAAELGQHCQDSRAVEALVVLAARDQDAAIRRTVDRALRRHQRAADA